MLDGRGELEVGGEEVAGPGQHQLVRLADSHVSHAYKYRIKNCWLNKKLNRTEYQRAALLI
jgi:hypothetical protein